jgi:CBS domain-containing protein
MICKGGYDRGMQSSVYFSSTAQAPQDPGGHAAYPWLRPMEEPMKITDTVDQILKNKALNKILPISPEQTVHDALSLMAEYDVGALMVMSGTKLVGILSERDYARKGILQGHASRDTKVSEIMTSPVISVTPQQTVDDCMNLMTQGHFRHLPVLDGDRVVGVISIGDMVKWVISGQEHAIQALEGYIMGAYPG